MFFPTISMLHSNLQQQLDNIQEESPAFTEILQDLNIQQSKITATSTRYALETILAIAIIEKNACELAKITDENKRNQKITDLTNLIAEPGLASGDDDVQILESLHQLAVKLFQAYKFDKEHEDTVSLYSCGFKGPPCFNGRIITLEEYIAGKQNLINPQLLTDVTDYDPTAYHYSELMYYCSDNSKPSYEEFVDYLKSLSTYSSEHANLVESDHFKLVYKRACELFVE